MKHASNGEVLLFKRPIEQKFSVLLSDLFASLNEDEVVDFEFISNAQAIQTGSGIIHTQNSSLQNNSHFFGFGTFRTRNFSKLEHLLPGTFRNWNNYYLELFALGTSSELFWV